MKQILPKLLVVTFLLALTQLLHARKIEVTDALSTAKNFIANTEYGKIRQKAIATNLELVYTESDANAPLYYVFNITGGGFVITAADDRATEILAYVDKGSYNPSTLPANMRWWLGEYARQIKAVCSMPEVTEQTHAAKAVKTEIKPLLETEWSQEAPFNQLCSYNNDTSISPALTGCVATAMSQIMYFHKWPEKGTGSYSYDYSIDVNGKEVQQHKESSFAEHSYDYAAMIPSYRSGYTQQQVDAVALLMFDCAISVNSLFNDTNIGTAGASNWAVYSFQDYFGYAKTAAEISRSNITNDDEWETLVYNDLQAGLPVFYSGNDDSGSGHTFVCDGYKDGLFHINWGWEGTFNGYFALSGSDALNPYTGAGLHGQGYHNDQRIITGLKPAKASSGVVAQDAITISQNSATRGDELFVSGNMINISNTEEVYMGLELTDVATGEKIIAGITDYTFAPGNRFSALLLNTSDIVKNGTFEVWPVYQISGTTEWIRIEAATGQNKAPQLTISGKTPTIYVTAPISFEHGNFTSIENLKLYVKLQALENVSNIEFRAYFKQPWDGQTGATLTGTVASLENGDITTLVLTPLGSTANLRQEIPYSLELYLYENEQNVKIPISSNTKINNAMIVSAEKEEELGIENVTTDNTIVDVFTIDGVLIRHKVSNDRALENLPKGIYIVNGRKMLVK